MIKHVHIQCSCHLPQHLLRVTLITSKNDYPEISIEPLLNTEASFLKRVYYALLYVFKGGRGICFFDDVILHKEEVDKLTSLISVYNVNYKLVHHLKNKKESVVNMDSPRL